MNRSLRVALIVAIALADGVLLSELIVNREHIDAVPLVAQARRAGAQRHRGAQGAIAAICCHQGVREIRLPQFTQGNR